MLPTPDLSHIAEETYLHVYEPAEDTFILLDALEKDFPYLHRFTSTTQVPLVVEIGSGSGCVSSFIQKEIFPHECLLFAVDISSTATLTTTATLEKNVPGQFNSVVQCDLLNGLRIDRSVDVLVFNPPYVPTDQEDSWAGDVAYAWRGGGMGMQTTWRVLNSLSEILSSEGVFYLVAVEPNEPNEIIKKMSEKGMHGEVLMPRRGTNGRLS